MPPGVPDGRKGNPMAEAPGPTLCYIRHKDDGTVVCETHGFFIGSDVGEPVRTEIIKAHIEEAKVEWRKQQEFLERLRSNKWNFDYTWPPRPEGWTEETEKEFAGVLTGHALIVKELRRIADAFEKIAGAYVNIAKFIEGIGKLVEERK